MSLNIERGDLGYFFFPFTVITSTPVMNPISYVKQAANSAFMVNAMERFFRPYDIKFSHETQA